MAGTEGFLPHHQRILALLDDHGAQYTGLHHEETHTSEESARVRGVDLSIGGKALLLKVDNEFSLFVISASRKLHSKSIKKEFKAKNVRFATLEELAELTGGLVPGAVPPIGKPIMDFDLYLDSSITENGMIAFNAGSLSDSIIMPVEDYLRLVAPQKIFNFSKEK